MDPQGLPQCGTMSVMGVSKEELGAWPEKLSKRQEIKIEKIKASDWDAQQKAAQLGGEKEAWERSKVRLVGDINATLLGSRCI